MPIHTHHIHAPPPTLASHPWQDGDVVTARHEREDSRRSEDLGAYRSAPRLCAAITEMLADELGTAPDVTLLPEHFEEAGTPGEYWLAYRMDEGQLHVYLGEPPSTHDADLEYVIASVGPLG